MLPSQDLVDRGGGRKEGWTGARLRQALEPWSRHVGGRERKACAGRPGWLGGGGGDLPAGDWIVWLIVRTRL